MIYLICKWLPTYRYAFRGQWSPLNEHIRSHFFLNQQWWQRTFLRMFATMRFDCTKRRRHLPISHTRAKMQLPSYLSPLKYGEHWKTLLQLIAKTLLWRTLTWVSCQVSLALEPLPLPWPSVMGRLPDAAAATASWRLTRPPCGLGSCSAAFFPLAFGCNTGFVLWFGDVLSFAFAFARALAADSLAADFLSSLAVDSDDWKPTLNT